MNKAEYTEVERWLAYQDVRIEQFHKDITGEDIYFNKSGPSDHTIADSASKLIEARYIKSLIEDVMIEADKPMVLIINRVVERMIARQRFERIEHANAYAMIITSLKGLEEKRLTDETL